MNLKIIYIVLIITLSALLLAYKYSEKESAARSNPTFSSANTMKSIAAAPNKLKNWPPVVNLDFPKINLIDSNGQNFDLESLRGRPVLIEMIAMPCGGCQAWSGGNIKGAFANLPVQKELQSIEEYYKIYTGGHELFSGEISFLQIVIYNAVLDHPTSEQLSAWSQHFGFDQHKNTFVVTGGELLANKESFVRIPGFYLLDRNLVVRYDSAGHSAPHNLYRELLPAVPKLIAEN